MKKRALQSLHCPDVAGHAAMHTAVGRVADDRMADGAEMDTNLMRAAGEDRDLAKREPRHVMRSRDPGHGMTGAARARRHLQAVRWVTSDGGLDPPTGLHDAPHEGDVLLLDFVIVELSRELVMGGVVLGDDHEAGCAAIEPMHDAWPRSPPTPLRSSRWWSRALTTVPDA